MMPDKPMEIHRLREFDERQFLEMHDLMCVLSTRCQLTPEMLQSAITRAHVYVMMEEGRIVGTATLCPFYSPTGAKASIEDVVILPEYQGRGWGRLLMEHVLSQARTMAPVTLQLTSRPSRVAANALYRQLGFQPKETNCYTLALLAEN